MEFIENLTYWHWLIIGIACGILEIVLPGVFFLWVGVASFVVAGLLATFSDMTWEVQFVIFSVSLVLSVLVGRQIYNRKPPADEEGTLNNPAALHKGKEFTLSEASIDKETTVTMGDTIWTVALETNLPKGTEIVITGMDGAKLTAKAKAEDKTE